MKVKPSTVAAVMNRDLLTTMPGLCAEAMDLIKFLAKPVMDSKLETLLEKSRNGVSSGFYSDLTIRFIASYLREKYPQLARTVDGMSLTTISKDNFCFALDEKNEMLDVAELAKLDFDVRFKAFRFTLISGGRNYGSKKAAVQPNPTSASFLNKEELENEIKYLKELTQLKEEQLNSLKNSFKMPKTADLTLYLKNLQRAKQTQNTNTQTEEPVLRAKL